MLNNFLLLFRALRAGESLANAAIWKQSQLRLNALLPIIYLLAHYLPIDLSADDVDAVATGIGMIGGAAVNIYLTIATTEKIGFGYSSRPTISDAEGGDS